MKIQDIFSTLGKAVRRLFSKKHTLESAFDIDIAVSSKMERAIQEWSKMYENFPPWKEPGISTLGLPAAIANEIARLVTMELKTSITGSPAADYLDEHYQEVIERARSYTEYACAKGGVILKPYIIPESGKIEVAVIQAEDFYPTDFDSSGHITGAVFPDQKIIGDKKYTRMERHQLSGTDYLIQNKVFVASAEEVTNQDDSILGKEILLSEVPIPEWAELDEEVHLVNLEGMLFAYFKMPMANNIELRSPLGVSVFSKATQLIKDADMQWANILWEYESKQTAVFGDTDIMMTDEHGNVILENREKRLFRTFQDFDAKLQEYSPEIRDTSMFNGLDKMLKQIEFQCSLAYGTISDPQSVDKTATEVKQSKQRSFSLVCDIQKAFQHAHEDLAYAMYALGSIYGVIPEGEYEVSFEFDDSIVVDREVEFSRLMQMVSAGMIRPEKVTAWYFGVTEEEALEMLPPAFDDTKDDSNMPEEE